MRDNFLLIRSPKTAESVEQTCEICYIGVSHNSPTSFKRVKDKKIEMDDKWGHEYIYTIARIYKKGE